MDEFKTVAKLWPSGADISPGDDSNIVTVPYTSNRTAAPFITSADGTQNYQFLFWNTGRHLTSKRKVRWNFSVGGWGEWVATRWYGIPGIGTGAARVRADAFTIGGDTRFADTPIYAGGSTLGGAPLGPPDYPFGGDDHEVSTAHGALSLAAKDPFTPSGTSGQYLFAGWLQLMWGGDPSGEFVETDTGVGGTGSSSTTYEHVIGGNFPAAAGSSADLIAAYGTHVADPGPTFHVIAELIERMKWPMDPEWWKQGDPSPEDWNRLRQLGDLLQKAAAQGAKPSGFGPLLGFEDLAARASSLSKGDARAAAAELKSTILRSQAALKALQLAAKGKGG